MVIQKADEKSWRKAPTIGAMAMAWAVDTKGDLAKITPVNTVSIPQKIPDRRADDTPNFKLFL